MMIDADYNFVIESYEINQQTSIIESVTSGNINDFQIVSAGSNFKVEDSLNLNNSTQVVVVQQQKYQVLKEKKLIMLL